MEQILMFLCGTLAGVGIGSLFTKKKLNKKEAEKYARYKRTSGLYEGVRRK